MIRLDIINWIINHTNIEYLLSRSRVSSVMNKIFGNCFLTRE